MVLTLNEHGFGSGKGAYFEHVGHLWTSACHPHPELMTIQYLFIKMKHSEYSIVTNRFNFLAMECNAVWNLGQAMQNISNAVVNRFLESSLEKKKMMLFSMFISVCFSQLFLKKIVHLFVRLERIESNGRSQPIFCIALEVRIVHLQRKCMSAPLAQKELSTRKIACRMIG